MSILDYAQIQKRCSGERPMISPYIDHKISENADGGKVISYGANGAGYDIRLGSVWKTFKPYNHPCIDPKNPESTDMYEVEPYYKDGSQYIILNAGESVLGASYERFRMPTNVMGICVGKSTYARAHIVPHVTPLEQGWGFDSDEGLYLTIELVNLGDSPTVLYLMEGILQIVFFETHSHDKYRGYYNGQTEPRPYRATENSQLDD